MTSLSDLTDVGSLAGAATGDYLAYDSSTSLWIAKALWQENAGTLTYPAGDNGWTYVEDTSAAPVAGRHVENTTTIPAADAALIDTISVTTAMVDVGGTSGLQYPAAIGLRFSCAGQPVNQTGTFTWRMALERNGTQVAYFSVVVFGTRERVAGSLKCLAEDGDTIKVHSWITAGTDADGVDFDLIVAAPVVLGFSVPAATEDGDLLFTWLDADPGVSLVETAPAGVSVEVTGASSASITYRYQDGATAGSVVETSTNRVLFGLLLPHDTTGVPFYNNATTATSSSAGDPLLIRGHQFTTYDFWTLQVPNRPV